MKKYFILCMAALALSCQSNTKSENANGTASEENGDQNTGTIENAALVAHPMLDNKGKLMAQMTLPANWVFNTKPGKASILGPKGIQVYNIPMRNFMFTNDQMTAQVYAQNGGKLRAPMSGEQIVRQDLLPVAKKDGSTLVKVYDAPSIAKSDGSIQDMMYHIGPAGGKYEAVVSEWKDKDGKPYAIVLHISRNDMGNMVMWNYYGQGLDAPPSQYESAKKTLLDGLASLQYNPRYFDQYNQTEMNRESASWAAHNQRMASQQRSFDAQQAAFKEKSDAINNSIMASYNAQNASSDRMHNRFINYIKDENTVVNRADGQRYQVQTGSNQYWMNENGQYIGTNDPNYDPNRNQGTVNHTWNEADPVD
jgi:hypothetical protein